MSACKMRIFKPKPMHAKGDSSRTRRAKVRAVNIRAFRKLKLMNAAR